MSSEAIVSMLLLIMLLSLPLPQQRNYLNDLHAFKKENDLLLLWMQQGSSLSLVEMQQDLRFAFPGRSGKILVDGKQLEIGRGHGKSIASEIVFFDSGMQKHEIRLTVFKQQLA